MIELASGALSLPLNRMKLQICNFRGPVGGEKLQFYRIWKVVETNPV